MAHAYSPIGRGHGRGCSFLAITMAVIVYCSYRFGIIDMLWLLAPVAPPANIGKMTRSTLFIPSSPLTVGGSPMPAVGFGTCCRAGANGPQLIKSVREYLRQGGRLIDTAMSYGNHREIGTAVRLSKVSRQEVWITTKVDPRLGYRTRTDMLSGVNQSLAELGFGWVELTLVHSPGSLSPAEQLDSWEGLIEARRRKWTTHIGVSNFVRAQIEALDAGSTVRPEALQLEFHPWVPSSTLDLVEWCVRKSITPIAYGSLGGAANKARGRTISALARAHGVSNAQLLLLWALERRVAIIPGATSAEHIRENLHLPPHLGLTDAEQRELRDSPKPLYFARWLNLPGESVLTFVREQLLG